MFNILVHRSRIPKAYGLLQENSPYATVYTQKHTLTEATIIKQTSENTRLEQKIKTYSSLLKKTHINPESLVQCVSGDFCVRAQTELR